MNINLLPQKFIKNRATDVIVLVTIAVSMFFILLFVGIALFYSVQLNQLGGSVQQAKVEKITLQNEATSLEESQSIELQNYLTAFKADRRLVSPMMASFERVAGELNLKILNYQLVLMASTDQTNKNGEIGLNGEELLQPVTIRLRGDLFDNTPKFKEELEKLDWIYDVQPVRMTSENTQTDSEFIVRIKKNEAEELLQEKGDEA